MKTLEEYLAENTLLKAENTLLKTENEKLKKVNDALANKVKNIEGLITNKERNWIIAARAVAFIIGFLPFIPNTLYYIGIADTKTPIGTADVFFVVVGFIILWGSRNFGEWANSLGKSAIKKADKFLG